MESKATASVSVRSVESWDELEAAQVNDAHLLKLLCNSGVYCCVGTLSPNARFLG